MGCPKLPPAATIGTKPENGYPVIVWIHPGNFTTGTPTIWNPHTLVHRQKIIIVTFSYRLNVMGFFTTLDGEAVGNYGLMDQQAALRWVKSYINLFDGDPNNIVLMGSGAGGISVGIHMINTDSRGLFNKAIIMSANFMSKEAFAIPEEEKSILDQLADRFGCVRHPTSKRIGCLRGVDADILVNGTSYVNWRPIIDKDLNNSTTPFLSDLPKSYFERADFYPVPLLTGYTHMEKILSIKPALDDNLQNNISGGYLNEILKDIISQELEADLAQPEDEDSEYCSFNDYSYLLDAVVFFYDCLRPIDEIEKFRKIVVDITTEKDYGAPTIQQAVYVSSENQPTFVYRFDVKPSSPQVTANIPKWVTVPHLFDLIYVWGVPYWRHDAAYDVRDKRLSDTIMNFWTEFARNSRPTKNTSYPINWLAFTRDTPNLLLIDNTLAMNSKERVNFKAFEFWNDYYPKILQIGKQCCAATGSAPRHSGYIPCIIFLFAALWITITRILT